MLGTDRSACRKSLFDTLPNFLKLQKSFEKLFDLTRKGTLTVPFHTILPSESFGWRVIDSLSGQCLSLTASSFYYHRAVENAHFFSPCSRFHLFQPRMLSQARKPASTAMARQYWIFSPAE